MIENELDIFELLNGTMRNKIIDVRKQAGLSIAELAERCGLNEQELTEMEKGNIAVDENMQTNLAGVFAAGDCASSFKQIATAVGQGCLAAEGIIKYIKKIRS